MFEPSAQRIRIAMSESFPLWPWSGEIRMVERVEILASRQRLFNLGKPIEPMADFVEKGPIELRVSGGLRRHDNLLLAARSLHDVPVGPETIQFSQIVRIE